MFVGNNMMKLWESWSKDITIYIFYGAWHGFQTFFTKLQSPYYTLKQFTLIFLISVGLQINVGSGKNIKTL